MALRHLRRIYRKVRPKYGHRSPIIVHTMGKVGSMSVTKELLRRGVRVPVHHTHFLDDLDRFEAEIRRGYADPRSSLEAIAIARQVREDFEGWRGPPWSVISLVRDPVSRLVSQFIYMLESHLPDVRRRLEMGTLDMQELRELFLRAHPTGPSEGPERDFFDNHVRGPLGIDVYETPFPTDRGYAIYEADRARMLLIRLEDLSARSVEAFGTFLGIPDFRPGRDNIGEENEWSREIYPEFKRSVALPEEFLDHHYACRVARHFYSNDELAGFRSRWSSSGPSPAGALAGSSVRT